MPPNQSFKPTLLRSTKPMAGRACHGFGSATQRGLTQSLGSGKARGRGASYGPDSSLRCQAVTSCGWVGVVLLRRSRRARSRVGCVRFVAVGQDGRGQVAGGASGSAALVIRSGRRVWAHNVSLPAQQGVQAELASLQQKRGRKSLPRVCLHYASRLNSGVRPLTVMASAERCRVDWRSRPSCILGSRGGSFLAG